MQIFRLSTACVKVHQIPHVIFFKQKVSFSSKLDLFFVSWGYFFCAETLYVIDKSSTTSKCKFSGLLLLTLKFNKFLITYLEPSVSFSSNFALPFSVMSGNSSALFHLNLYMIWKNKPIKVQVSRLSTGHIKTNQLPYVIFEATSQFSGNFCITLPFHVEKCPSI